MIEIKSKAAFIFYMKIFEIQTQKVLALTKISLANYVINPYIGCQYGCLYCYAKYLKRSVKQSETRGWGEFVNVKINAVEVLKKELEKLNISAAENKPVVMLGSITEVYQPLEKKYKLTEQILKILIDFQIPTVILTRSNLILRDIELLKKLPKVSVFFTITSNNSLISQHFENQSPDYNTRLETIKKLRENNINVWAHIGPIIPYFTDTLVLIKDLKNIVSKIEFEALNTTTAPYNIVVEKLKNIDINKAVKFMKLYQSSETFNEYWHTEKNNIIFALKNTDIKTHFSFPQLNEYF